MPVTKMSYTYSYKSPAGTLHPIAWETTVSEAGNLLSLGMMVAGKKWNEKEKKLFKNPYAQFLKVNTAPTGAETPVYEYVDVSGLVEYVTSGSQAGDMIYVSIDPTTHEVTATITDGTVTKAKLVTAVQSSLDKADSALQEADFEWATDAEVNTSWAAALAAAKTPAQSGSGEGE